MPQTLHYAYEKILQQLKKQANSDHIYIFFPDVDNTLIRFLPKSTPEQVLHDDKITKHIFDYAAQNAVPLIPATGRAIQGEKGLVELLTKRFNDYYEQEIIPIAITSVGTRISLLNENHTWERDEEYAENIRQETGYDHDKIYELLAKPNGIVEKLTNKFPGINLHLQSKYHHEGSNTIIEQFKISYYFEGNEATRGEVQKYTKELLEENGFPKVFVVTSEDIPAAHNLMQYNLDLLAVTKDYPVNYILQKLQKHISQQIIAPTFGDSGNDINMILNGGTFGVVVNDATVQLKNAVDTLTVREEDDCKLLITNYKKRVVYASPFPCPQAILDLLENRTRIAALVSSKLNLYN